MLERVKMNEAAANKHESAMEQKPFQKRENRNAISRRNDLVSETGADGKTFSK
ncbi:MAG: hypothetical protein FWH36_08565 [Lentimicrobiaceae bacterium]|nr:hypothetical protein [Lentimicrobiaceae bacterium]